MTGESGLAGRVSQGNAAPWRRDASDRNRPIARSKRPTREFADSHTEIADTAADWLPLLEIDVLPTAAYVCDSRGVIVDYNRFAADLWGRSPIKGDARETYCGFARRFRLDGSELPLEHSPVAHALAAGKRSHDIELTAERSDGSKRTVLFNVGPVRGGRNEILGAVIVVQDINGWKLTTESLQQTEMHEMLQRFAADIAHRYCNLFATISTNLGVAKKRAAVPAIEGQIAAIGRSVADGLAFTNRLLAFARNPGLVLNTQEAGFFDQLIAPPVPEHQGSQPASSDMWLSDRGRTVLLVGDDPAVRAVASDALATMGFSVLGAECDASALDIVRSDRSLDVAVIHVGVAPNKGLEVLREIRATRPELRMLVITGHPDVPENLADCDDSVALLKMPFRVEDFAKGIRAMVARRDW